MQKIILLTIFIALLTSCNKKESLYDNLSQESAQYDSTMMVLNHNIDTLKILEKDLTVFNPQDITFKNLRAKTGFELPSNFKIEKNENSYPEKIYVLGTLFIDNNKFYVCSKRYLVDGYNENDSHHIVNEKIFLVLEQNGASKYSFSIFKSSIDSSEHFFSHIDGNYLVLVNSIKPCYECSASYSYCILKLHKNGEIEILNKNEANKFLQEHEYI